MSIISLIVAATLSPLDDPAFARPVRIVAHQDAVYVANSGDGTISVLDPNSMQQRSRDKVARRISDFVSLGDRGFAVLDPEANELIIIDSSTKPVSRIKVQEPGQVAFGSDGSLAVVTSRWQKQVELIDLNDMEMRPHISLGFEPHAVTHLKDDRFLVADAFGGYLAVVRSDGTTTTTKIHGHNIRGLLVQNDEVLISHQQLSEVARTDFSDVHWGSLIQSVITKVAIEDLSKANPKTSTIVLSDVGRGGADPGTAVGLKDGRLAVIFQGVDELIVSPEPTRNGLYLFEEGIRFDTGKRPSHVVSSPAEDRLFVANAFDNSITVVPVPERRAKPWQGRVSAQEIGVPKTFGRRSEEPLTAEQRGELAFFSGKISHDGWLSCNSCHVDGHTFGARADTFGDGSFGAPKLVPSLLGVADTSPFGWSGNFTDLEKQIHKSIETTLRGEGDGAVANDLAAYLRTLKPRPGASQKNELVVRGRAVFEEAGCINCHESTRFTSDKVVDVGFKDKLGQTRFNPPSLRGLSHRRSFFHDARAHSLDDAIRLHLAGLKKELNDDHLAALKAYLQSL